MPSTLCPLYRGREVKKNGAGSRNWGSHDAHDVDGATATADSAEAEGGGWGTGASNGNANESTEVCLFEMRSESASSVL